MRRLGRPAFEDFVEILTRSASEDFETWLMNDFDIDPCLLVRQVKQFGKQARSLL